MYGLPKDFSAQVFVGATLEQICFFENQIRFILREDLSITVEASFSYSRDDSGKSMTVYYMPVLSTDVMAVIGRTVSSAAAESDGTLSLTFDNGCVVAIYDVSDRYESYRIKAGERDIIV